MTFIFNIFSKNSCKCTCDDPICGDLRCDMTVIRGVMELLSFLAHTAILPLAFLELFSNYAWICFTGDTYCGTDVSENRLQNDRNFILIGFFMCAAILGLYNKLVKIPLKAKDRVKELAEDFKNRVTKDNIKKCCCCCCNC